MGAASHWAARQSPARPLDKLVLLGFAECADQISFECFPSIAWLCDWTGCDRKTVIKSTSSLENAGLLLDTGARRGRTAQVKVYRLPCPSVPETAPFEIGTVPKTAPLKPAKSTVFPSKASQKRDTEPPQEPSSTETTSLPKKRVRATAAQGPTDIPEWVPLNAWNGWIEMRKGIRKPLTPHAAKLALAQLENLKDDGHPPGPVIDQATLKNWLSFYPIKDHGNGLSQRNGNSGVDGSPGGGAPRSPRRGYGADMLAAALARPEDYPEGDPRDCGGDEGPIPAYLRR